MNDFCYLLFEEANKKQDGLIQDFMENHNNEIIPFWEYFDSSNNSILTKTIFNEMYNDFNFLCNYLETNLKNKDQIEKYINTQNNQGFTSIHYASFKGKISVISRLLKLNANISIQNAKGLTVLHLAAQGNQPNSLAYFKEKCNENLNKNDKAHSTPLHWACYTGSLKAVDYLLCNEVDLDQTDDQRVTALHLAVMSDNIQIIKRLLRAGADRNIKDSNDRTPGDLAIFKKKQCAKIFKMKKKRCCNCIVIKTPNTKINRSKKNIYLFLSLYIFSIITESIFVIDKNKINLILVGNKRDIINFNNSKTENEEDNINNIKCKREISYEEGEKMAESCNINFIETSALNSYNIEKCFDILINEIINKKGKNNILKGANNFNDKNDKNIIINKNISDDNSNKDECFC